MAREIIIKRRVIQEIRWDRSIEKHRVVIHMICCNLQIDDIEAIESRIYEHMSTCGQQPGRNSSQKQDNSSNVMPSP
jgi:predicted transcriptional regulator YheO